MSTLDYRNQDPIQGHDVWVTAFSYDKTGTTDDQAFQNAFTDIMFKVVNQTEAYLPLFSRVPRYLDGEIIIVWSCSAGTLSLNFIDETFGKDFASAIENGRTAKVPRSRRFNLTFTVSAQEIENSEAGMRNSFTTGDNKNLGMRLTYCRCDTLSFGIQAGKSYAVNSWQGTAEGLDDNAVVTKPV